MKKLFKNGSVVNVFTGELEERHVLIEDGKILGVGDYSDEDADQVVDVSGKIICPGLIDAHIHIESTMLLPEELTKVCLPHGTTSMIADPHEIANVCGKQGISFMIQASKGLPMSIYYMLPSCVPATGLDEAGAILEAEDLLPFYKESSVLGLGEVMNYPGVIAGDEKVLAKIRDAKESGAIVNGHAPMLSGKALDQYIAAGVRDDHECTSEEEAKERIRKGQWVMIRQGTAAKNLYSLLPLFEHPWSHRCMLATDDKHPADLLQKGHIDSIIREAAAAGKDPIVGIQMATIQAAQYYGLQEVGAIAPGYRADLLVLDDLKQMTVRDVYKAGKLVVSNREVLPFASPHIEEKLWEDVHTSFNLNPVTREDFMPETCGNPCRVIRVVPRELITEEVQVEIDWNKNHGIDLERDILKIAVLERHKNTGHVGLGFIQGLGLKEGAIASSVSHDSHNLIVVGTKEEDMAAVANHVRQIGGGLAVVKNGEVLADMPLSVAGLMEAYSAEDAALRNQKLREKAAQLGHNEDIEVFMNLAFVSLPVIPHLKLTTRGLVRVETQELVPLCVK